MSKKFFEESIICFLERVAISRGFLNNEIHAHSFHHEGKYLEAFPTPQLIIIPPSEEHKKIVVYVTCSVCEQNLHKTTKDMLEMAEEMMKNEPRKHD